jgi:hypothetical protein
MDIQLARPDQVASIIDLAEKVIGARADYRTDWFQCTFISLVVVDVDQRRHEIARSGYIDNSREPLIRRRLHHAVDHKHVNRRSLIVQLQPEPFLHRREQ